MAIPYRRFGTTYRSHLHGVGNFYGIDRFSRNVSTELPLLAAKPIGEAICFWKPGCGYICIHIHSHIHHLHKCNWMLNLPWKELNCNMQSGQSISYKVHKISKNMINYKKKGPYMHTIIKQVKNECSCLHHYDQQI